MSRRTTTTQGKAPGLSRVPSSASLAMPPPKVPTSRPPSVSANAGSSRVDSSTVPQSPRKISMARRNGPVNGLGSSAKGRSEGLTENGEINIQVVVRCRGRSTQELAASSPIITTTGGPLSKQITVETTPLASTSLASFTTASSYGAGGGPSTKTYPFDHVFGPEADQTMIFNEVAEGMLDEVLAGYNCTIFAYGQTGTGKTYTMQGDLALSPLSTPKDSAGIVPRVLHRLYSLLEASENTEYAVKCSYVELYNEELRDLLSNEYGTASSTSANGGGLKLYEDGKKGTMIQGLEEVGAKNLNEALKIVNRGVQKRQTAETKMNTESSRSHTIFSITVHVKEIGGVSGNEDMLKIGKFNLVDLAGSEAIGRSGATDKRAREAGMINQSLLTLGRVISALVEKGPHIPYRESKLTRLLQDSLGGKTKTCIVATVSPTRSNMEETLSTLDYAIRAKSIRNRPEVNAHMTKAGLLKEYLSDIERLKQEVLAAREKNGVYIPEEQWMEMQQDLARQKSDFEQAKLTASSCSVELATKKKEFDQLITKYVTTTEELESAREAERSLGVLMEQMRGDLEVQKQRLEEEMVVAQAYVRGEQRLDRVAESLKGVAVESVNDVEGLFDKLSRKAKVLGTNADAATKFGADLQVLSKDLRKGLSKIHAAHGEMGVQLKSELSTHAKRGQEISQQDVAKLESSFVAFNTIAEDLAKSIQAGQVESTQIANELLNVKGRIQSSMQDWAKMIGERSSNMVDDLLSHQQEHLSMVESVFGSAADLVDAVIATAHDHVSAQKRASEEQKRLATETANVEISRLQAQNALLSKLLTQEKAKTARLRTDLIANLSNLIVDFTDTQDASLSAAMAQVQLANDAGLRDMQAFSQSSQDAHAESSRRAEEFGEELEMAKAAGVQQRQSGTTALGHVNVGLKTRLEEYNKETSAETAERLRRVEGLCDDLAASVGTGTAAAVERSTGQKGLLNQVSSNVMATHQTSLSRTRGMCDDIASLTKTLLSTQASTSRSFDKYHQSATSSLSALVDRTGRFLTEDMVEDVSTGVTPKKKVWNVPTSWERTEPRDVLIQALRQRKQAGLPAVQDQQEQPLHASGSSGSVGSGIDSSLHRANSTISLVSSNSGSEAFMPVDDYEVPSAQVHMTTSHSGHLNHPDENVNALSDSTESRPATRMRIPSASMKGLKGEIEVERRKTGLTVLGEGGNNIPRRTKR